MPLKQKSSRSRKAWLPLIIVAVLVLIAAGGYLAFSQTGNRTDGEDRAPNSVNYEDPTPEEVAAGDSQKEDNKAREETDQKPVSDKADLVLVDAGQYDNTVEVRGYVTNRFEDGGTCTATFTKGAQTVSTQSSAFKDATTTQCGALDLPRSDFPDTGTWQLKLEYSSAGASGETTSTVSIK